MGTKSYRKTYFPYQALYEIGLFLGVIKLLPLFLFILVTSCHQRERAKTENSSLKFYTVRSIDSLVASIEDSVSNVFTASDTTLTHFISSKERRLVNNYRFQGFTNMIFYVQRLGGDQGFSVRRFYFKDDQLIKVSFTRIKDFSATTQGSYYYSKEKAFLVTTSNRSLPRPDAALQQAKYYLKNTK